MPAAGRLHKQRIKDLGNSTYLPFILEIKEILIFRF